MPAGPPHCRCDGETPEAVVILEADPLRARAFAQIAAEALPSAHVSTTCNYEHAVDLAWETDPLLVLISLSVAGIGWWRHIDGFVRDFSPQSLVLAVDSGSGRVFRALRWLKAAGVCSQIHDSDVTIVSAFRAVADGRRFVSPAVEWFSQDRTWPWIETILTPLEETVLSFTDVLGDKQLAPVLDMSREALRRHRSNIASRLDLHGAAELRAFALEHGYVARLPGGRFVPGLMHAIITARALAALQLRRGKVKRAELTIVKSVYW